MKGSKYEFDGCEYTLCYTGTAKFSIDEIIGTEDLSAALLPKTVEDLSGCARLPQSCLSRESLCAGITATTTPKRSTQSR